MKRANQEESILDKVTAEIRNQQVDPKRSFRRHRWQLSGLKVVMTFNR